MIGERLCYRFIILFVFLFGLVACAHPVVQKPQAKLVPALLQAQLSIKNRQFSRAKNELNHLVEEVPLVRDNPVYWSYCAQVALGLGACKIAVDAGARAWRLAPESLSAANNYLVLLCLAANKAGSAAQAAAFHKRAVFVFMQALQKAPGKGVGITELRANAKHCHINA